LINGPIAFPFDFYYHFLLFHDFGLHVLKDRGTYPSLSSFGSGQGSGGCNPGYFSIGVGDSVTAESSPFQPILRKRLADFFASSAPNINHDMR
jgi:hypothetical protein